jgi:aspartate-semialdehyde dehydrogenase
MKKPAYSVAVVGATGLVGAEIVATLEQRLFPVGDLQLYASLRSAGDEVRCGQHAARVQLLEHARFEGIDLLFFAAGEQVSAECLDRATSAGAVVIDASQLFADDPDVPLIVPEINAADLAGYTTRGLVSSPDSPAIALAIVLNPLHAAAGVSRVVASTYEPVSEGGRAGVEELQQQTIGLMSGESVEPKVFPHRIAFNVLPQIGEFLAGGASRGERQTAGAVRRLLGAPELTVSVTRARIPLFYGTALSVQIETVEKLTAAAARELLQAAPGVLLCDDLGTHIYPTPADAVGVDATFVGRIRESEADNSLDLWIAIDNIRKGSAANLVQIAELLVRDYL